MFTSVPQHYCHTYVCVCVSKKVKAKYFQKYTY